MNFSEEHSEDTPLSDPMDAIIEHMDTDDLPVPPYVSPRSVAEQPLIDTLSRHEQMLTRKLVTNALGRMTQAANEEMSRMTQSAMQTRGKEQEIITEAIFEFVAAMAQSLPGLARSWAHDMEGGDNTKALATLAKMNNRTS